MMESVMEAIDNDFMTIKEESDDEKIRYTLYVGKSKDSSWLGNRMAVTQDRKNGAVVFHSAFYGPIKFEEMKLILEGLLELSVIGDQLTAYWETNRAKKKI
jgi:hypothetical protein